jgi:beta-galactosidase
MSEEQMDSDGAEINTVVDSRIRLPLNEDWFFQPTFDLTLCQEDYTDPNLVAVRLPHSVVETPLNYFREDVYQMVSGYRRALYVPQDWQGRTLQLIFEGAAHHAIIYFNGELIQEHLGGYTAFRVNLTEHVKYGATNIIAVQLDSRETLNIPPFGYVIDYMTYGGLYREVFLEVLNPLHIEDVFVSVEKVLSPQKTLRVQTTLNSRWTNRCKLRHTLYDEDKTLVVYTEDTVETLSAFQVSDVTLWSIETPKLYWLETALLIEGLIADVKRTRFGFREAIFKEDGFYLNGEKVKIRGLNRHQSYPYVGYAMPKGPQVLDADLMKYELAVNTVRTAHYPQSQYFVDRCDEIGLLVFTELPGWQHMGDEMWKAIAVSHVSEMVKQYRNHPSVILWGVRINESEDDDEFYTKTNNLARELDPSRQTGGVRCFKKSGLLEDVYTYNDFLHQGNNPGIDLKKSVTSNATKGYLVTEFNGHMYPTKSFDTAVVRVDHAHRHAKVLNDIYGQNDVAGGIGWCLFDYNTHKDFGSGDRICYHGVLDMFRNHKLAASVYSSQGHGTDIGSTVLQVASDMGIGDYPSGFIGSVSVFSNGDLLKVYKNNVFIKSYEPDRVTYPHLPHPPFTVDDFIGETMAKEEGYSTKKAETIKSVLLAGAKYGQSGLPLKYKLKALKLMVFDGFKVKDAMALYGKYLGNWGAKVTTYTFEAIKNGKVVKTVRKSPVEAVRLEVLSDTNTLVECSSYEVATIRIRAVDQNGNLLPYYQEPIGLYVTGDLALIGPSIISLKGGMGGTYIKSMGKTGVGQLTVKFINAQPETNSQEVTLSFDIEISH